MEIDMKCKVPFLSIIVPAYNVENYIRQCVDSILAQSYTDFELLLVDDGSKDGTGKICDEYAHKDVRVRVIHKQNGGLVSARKAGLAEAVGEYASYVDGDDWVAADMFQKLCECATMQKADIVIADCYCAYSDKNIRTTQNMRTGRYSKAELAEEVYPHMLCKDEYFSFGFFPCVWGKIFKRNLLLPNQMQVDGSIRLGEDAACLYPVLLDADSIYYLKEQYLYYYRIRQSSMSHSVAKSFYTDGIIKLVDGMKLQFEKHTELWELLQKQLWLYACYMFDNMLSACLNFKSLFFSKEFSVQLKLIRESSAGKEMIAFCKKVRTSSRAKRILWLLEKDGIGAKIDLYLFYKYERIMLRARNRSEV